MPVVLTVNGEARATNADPTTPLIFVLRNDFSLYGAKLGCAAEQCGSCTVLLDDEPAFACSVTVESARHRAVTTLEGLGSRTRPHALQRAFLAENAAQCGFCTAGMIVRAAALLQRNAEPSDADIRRAMEGNLCRCGAHPRILRAIKRAAAQGD
jgi:aerobic-type carbon monoxide dehydrogenase small subunit (CoxS/CutS family)